MHRILITGSRAFKDIDKVYEVLDDCLDSYGPFVLVHGNCKKGADNFAHQWYIWIGEDSGVVEEPHDADWKPWGKSGGTDYSAGLKRNHKMVALGADVCLAFPTICTAQKKNCPKEPHYSHGTADCMATAEKAGIVTKNYGPGLDRP